MEKYNIVKRIDKDYQKNTINYYFVIFPPHFQPLTKLWTESLNCYFNKKFKPIYILTHENNLLSNNDNFIIINNNLSNQGGEIRSFEERNLNKIISDSLEIEEIIDDLVKKQDQVLILPYTSSGINLKNNKIKILASNPKIANKYDKKINAYNLFKLLKINHPKFELIKYYLILFFYKKPFFLTGMFSSSSRYSDVINNNCDLIRFFLKNNYENRKLFFIKTDFIPKILNNPSCHGFISDKNKVSIIGVCDQIINKNKYSGGTIPSILPTKTQLKIEKNTKKIGLYLAKENFKGFFGVDYLIDNKNNIYASDLNPRRSNSYFAILDSHQLGTKKIIHEEINVFFNKKLNSKLGSLKSKKYFLYSSINGTNKKIVQEIKKNKNICLFYKKNSFIKHGAAGYIFVKNKKHHFCIEKLNFLKNLVSNKYLSSTKVKQTDLNLFKSFSKILFYDLRKFLQLNESLN